jgi:hypothetical protein
LKPSDLQEFTALLRDTRQFIEGHLRPSPSFGENRPVLLAKKAPATAIVDTPATLIVKPKTQGQRPLKGGWDLHPMPAPADFSYLRQKLAVFTSTQEPPLKVILVLPEENSHHRLFLENVSKAVTRSFASATVVLYEERLFQQKGIVLAPLSLLLKKFPKAQAHIPFCERETIWIPLENLDIYSHDVNCKRALWKSIQHSFQSFSI